MAVSIYTLCFEPSLIFFPVEYRVLDKSDAFFTQAIECLVEGLPGTEVAPLYVFHANRTGGSQAWVHEAKIRQQTQHQKRQSMVDSKGSRQSSGNSKRDRERVSGIVSFIDSTKDAYHLIGFSFCRR